MNKNFYYFIKIVIFLLFFQQGVQSPKTGDCPPEDVTLLPLKTDEPRELNVAIDLLLSDLSQVVAQPPPPEKRNQDYNKAEIVAKSLPPIEVNVILNIQQLVRTARFLQLYTLTSQGIPDICPEPLSWVPYLPVFWEGSSVLIRNGIYKLNFMFHGADSIKLSTIKQVAG